MLYIFLLIKLVFFFMFHQHKSKTPIFSYISLWNIFHRVEINNFYTNGKRNHGYIWRNCYLKNNRLFASIVHYLCGSLSISGGSDSTSVRTVSQHLIQLGFSFDNVIPPSLNNFKWRCITGKRQMPQTLHHIPRSNIFSFIYSSFSPRFLPNIHSIVSWYL